MYVQSISHTNAYSSVAGQDGDSISLTGLILEVLCDLFADGGYGERLFAPIAVAASIGLISAVIIHLQRRKEKPAKYDNRLAPLLEWAESGRLAKIERFSHYLGNKYYVLYLICLSEIHLLPFNQIRTVKVHMKKTELI